MQGVPTHIVYGGKSLVITLFAPIQQPSPIFTPDEIKTSSPIQASLPIITGPLVLSLSGEFKISPGCFELKYFL